MDGLSGKSVPFMKGALPKGFQRLEPVRVGVSVVGGLRLTTTAWLPVVRAESSISLSSEIFE